MMYRGGLGNCFGQGNGTGNGYNMMHYGMGGGIFMMIIVVALIGVLVYLIVKNTRNRQQYQGYHGPVAGQGTPGAANVNEAGTVTEANNQEVLNELNMRFAKGEITEEEYVSKKNILNL